MRIRPIAKLGELLTPSELEVLRLKCKGLADKQIAAVLNCSPRTVNNHCWRIFRKAGCHGAALGVWAIKHGLFSIDTTTAGQSSARLGADVRPNHEQGDGQPHPAAPQGDK